MMTKTLLLSFFISAWPICSCAMEIKEVQASPFDLITDGCIKAIAGRLDMQSCARMRQVCRRFNNDVWQFDQPCEIKLQKNKTRDHEHIEESEQHYWQRVFAAIKSIEALIKRFDAHNDIVLYPCLGWIGSKACKLSLPEELSKTNVNGLHFRYDSFKQSELVKLPTILPNLKLLDLIGHPLKQKGLPCTLKQLTKLQTFTVDNYKINTEDFEKIPSSVITLALEHGDISTIAVQAIARLTSLRSLSLAHNRLDTIELENLAPLAGCLEKLNISFNALEELPYCLANFTKLQELDLASDKLNPDALERIIGLQNLRLLHLLKSQDVLLYTDMVPKTVIIKYRGYSELNHR